MQLQGTKAAAIDSKVKRTFTLRHKKEAKALPFDTNEVRLAWGCVGRFVAHAFTEVAVVRR
jgi:hypothetical protein